jgi:hypothetical protein
MVLTGLRTVSQADTEMIEKRKKNRQLCVGTVYYTDLNDSSNAIKKTARCSNACPSGMCIFTSKDKRDREDMEPESCKRKVVREAGRVSLPGRHLLSEVAPLPPFNFRLVLPGDRGP